MKKVLAGSLLPLVLLVLLLIAGCQKENPTTAPKITTSAASSIGISSAVCGGNLTSLGGELLKEQGVCWSTTPNPTLEDSKLVDASGLRTFTLKITGLAEGTTYHFRAYASNIVGIAYGEDAVFTTSLIPAPTLTTNALSLISYTTATCGGVIVTDGGAPITVKGVCWSTTADPTTADPKTTDGTGTAGFTSNITGLTPATAYHVRAYATNAKGTSYGEDLPFTTLTIPTGVPTVTTKPVTSITALTAVSGGDVLSNGGEAITAKGVCWSLTANPTTANSKTTDGSGSANYVSNLTDLTASSTYYVRAYATNSLGTSYGSPVVFSTPILVSTAEEEILLGNPSNATTNSLSPDYYTNYLMSKPQYCLSFNNTTHNTNWTSWHLYSGDIGSAARTPSFSADASLPAGFYQVGNGDYSFATYGFERGHMCPSADRTSNADNNAATFVMTNAIPQAPNCNGITWGALEDYCRTLLGTYELYIICGPSGQGGTSAVGTYNNVNAGVVVPAYVWKIVVVIPKGNDDISRITTSTRVIAVKMPNTQTCSLYDWKHYRVSVDELETLTTFDFLSNVPTGIQAVIEAKVDDL